MIEKFTDEVNNYQAKLAFKIGKIKKRIIILKAQHFFGKTTILKHVFDLSNYDLTIFHTGCNPKYFDKSRDDFLAEMELELMKVKKNDKILILLDEYYDDNIIKYFLSINYNVKVVIATNSSVICHNKDILLIDFANDIRKIIFKYINKKQYSLIKINLYSALEIIKGEKNYDIMLNIKEKMRTSTNKTSIIIKSKNYNILKTIEFK